MGNHQTLNNKINNVKSALNLLIEEIQRDGSKMVVSQGSYSDDNYIYRKICKEIDSAKEYQYVYDELRSKFYLSIERNEPLLKCDEILKILRKMRNEIEELSFTNDEQFEKYIDEKKRKILHI